MSKCKHGYKNPRMCKYCTSTDARDFRKELENIAKKQKGERGND